MRGPAVEVAGVWKEYFLGRPSAYFTFRGMVAGTFGTALSRLRAPRRPQAEPGHFWGLRDVSFNVAPGEIVGVIGSNGAGKSTLLKILSRITEPTRGEVRIRGRVSSLLEVGTGFHPELTGRENVFLNGSILGMTRREIRSKFDEIVAFAEVEKFIDTPVKRYSSGMYVRLAFAVAAHLEPEVLLVDEVLAVGDAAFQKKCLGKMDDIARHQGRTILFVSHNLPAIHSLTRRCIVLHQGMCVADAPSAEAVAAYLGQGKGAEGDWVGDAHPGEPRVVRACVQTSRQHGVQGHGETMRLRFTLDVPFHWDRCCLAFQICNEMDEPMTHCWTFDREQGVSRAPGKHELVCEIPKVRLYMGRYYVKMHLSEDQLGKNFQTVERACPFEVVMGEARTEWAWREGAAAYLEDAVWSSSR
jgi:lipopolysaccharide transport system ATP-binding protein